MIKSGQLKQLPNTPGVYLFKRGRDILYIGKATSLRDRVKSYFRPDLVITRGGRLLAMRTLATKVDYRPTDSVLEALILEAALIKKHQPKYNAKEKDDRSFWFVVVTKEKYPRVLLVRGKDLGHYPKAKIFGPFPYSTEIRTALKLIRKIFPFRDRCVPESGQACFNYQIGLCPGVCNSLISRADYGRLIRQLKLFFSGRKQSLLTNLKREMALLAREQKFELAGEVKKRLFALQHIQDISLIKEESIQSDEDGEKSFRVEAYDIAHLAGQNAVGVMVVLENGELAPNEYRKFKLRETKPGDDPGGLKEILTRRLNHPEWPWPDLIIIDGGKTQLNTSRRVLDKLGWKNITVVSVVKDDKHRAREILGDKTLAQEREREIIKANHEAHRFALAYHRSKRFVL